MTRSARFGDALLWLTAVFGLAVIAVTGMMWVTGTRAIVVQSGSMAPTIPVRSVVLTHRVDAADIRDGDVVAVTLASGQRVLHRVLDASVDGGRSVTLHTKGDANRHADAASVVLPSTASVWRAGAHLPAIGGAVAALRTPVAGIVLALLVLGPAALVRRPQQPALA